MDLNRFNTTVASDIEQTLELINPYTGQVILDENDQPLELYLYGMQSTAARNALADRERKSGKNKTPTLEQSRRIGAEFLAAITAGWSDNFELDGEPLKYSRQNAIKLYMEQDWIGRQAMDFAGEITNYDPEA